MAWELHFPSDLQFAVLLIKQPALRWQYNAVATTVPIVYVDSPIAR